MSQKNKASSKGKRPAAKINFKIVSVSNQHFNVPHSRTNPPVTTNRVITPYTPGQAMYAIGEGSAGASATCSQPRVRVTIPSRKSVKSPLTSELAKKRAAKRHRDNEKKRHTEINRYTDMCVSLLPNVVDRQERLKTRTQTIVAYVCFLEQKIDSLCAELNYDRELYRFSSVKENTLLIGKEIATTSNLKLETFEPVSMLNLYLHLIGTEEVITPKVTETSAKESDDEGEDNSAAEGGDQVVAEEVEVETVSLETQATTTGGLEAVEQTLPALTEDGDAVSSLLAVNPNAIRYEPEPTLYNDLDQLVPTQSESNAADEQLIQDILSMENEARMNENPFFSGMPDHDTPPPSPDNFLLSPDFHF